MQKYSQKYKKIPKLDKSYPEAFFGVIFDWIWADFGIFGSDFNMILIKYIYISSIQKMVSFV
jgi:hypothetical protein